MKKITEILNFLSEKYVDSQESIASIIKHFTRALLFVFVLFFALFIVPLFIMDCIDLYRYQNHPHGEIARVHADFRSIATALETFYIDNKDYPSMEEDCSLPKELTTPIAYLSSLPDFKNSRSQKGIGKLPVRYFIIDKGQNWILQNCGPDGDYDLTAYHLIQMINESETEYSYFMKDGYYDPTNGTDSSGDIFRVKE